MAENDSVKDGIVRLEEYLSKLGTSDTNRVEAEVGRI